MWLSILLKIILVLTATEKASQIQFLFEIQNICLNGLKVGICFQNYQTYYFFYSQESKFSTIKELFLSQGTFPQSRTFLTVKELLSWSSCGYFAWSRKFSTKKSYLINKIFHKKMKFSTVKEIFHKKKNYLIKKNFYKQEIFSQNFFPWSWKFSTNKDFYTVKTFFCKQWSKGFSKS